MKQTTDVLLQHLSSIRPTCQEIALVAAKYDFKPNLPGNGYHSMLTILRKCLLKILETVQYIAIHKESCLFSIASNQQSLNDYIVVLGQMRACLYYMIKLKGFCGNGQFFPDPDCMPEDEYNNAVNIMFEYEMLNPECFYGRCFGFQFCKSIAKVLTLIHQAMVYKSLVYNKPGRLTNYLTCLTEMGVYLRNAAERGRQITKVTRECDVSFCQEFWTLSENKAVLKFSLMTTERVSIDVVIDVPLKMVEYLVIPPNPDDYKNTQFFNGTTKQHIPTRLISSVRRVGQVCLVFDWLRAYEPSPNLIIHFHGGGFLGQSSASHEVYLRRWAVGTGSPIFSVDYSYSPQFKAPFQLEEAFFAYCWALENCKLLGSTGKRICITGDSAGGNLAIGVCLMAIQRNVRIPDALYPLYPCLLIQYKPGPSRMLSIMDPLIPMGVLANCLQGLHNLIKTKDVKNTHNRNDSGFFDAFNLRSGRTGKGKRTKISNTEDHEYQEDNTDTKFNNKIKQGNTKRFSYTIEETSCDGSDDDDDNYSSNINNNNNNNNYNNTDDFDSIISQTSNCGDSNDSISRNASISSFSSSSSSNIGSSNNGSSSSSCRYSSSDSIFISPVLAPDHLLRKLPKTHITACHLDPLLDDSVLFARKIRDLGVDVDLDFVSDLPHGFMNFVNMSREAYNAGEMCLKNLKSLLDE
ncbi:hypothetical protein HELRODRAFT_111475 [Helobdella robusta]|uniref:Hormone-sensitive lipase n=1 Tax=Helobdella robusta TaxID=6412 RepID=T1EFB6_HELRO|nr:hypothetical protein HELRODRAFT_111475 [Helobdella robusta]ESO05029.1 hypothetical protein HELRODRAFT_111475 [Helobdella robusta]